MSESFKDFEFRSEILSLSLFSNTKVRNQSQTKIDLLIFVFRFIKTFKSGNYFESGLKLLNEFSGIVVRPLPKEL